MADRPPGTHVLRLLLCPHDLVQIGIRRHELGVRVHGERVQLLEPGNRDLVRSRPLLVPHDVVVHLSRADDEARHALAIRTGIVDDLTERTLCELGERRRGLLQPKQAFRCHHDERTAGSVEGLAAEQVKILARRRAVRDADVLLRGELEESLEARARMLGAVALVSVRQQERQARRLPPLGETGDDELVDHDLRAVDEVAELRLPQNECLGRGNRVAVLEAEARVLGQRRVVDLEGRRLVVEVLQRRVRLSGQHVVEHRVAVREGSALGVLAGEPDRDAFHEEGSECERFRLTPIDPTLFDRLQTPLELAL